MAVSAACAAVLLIWGAARMLPAPPLLEGVAFSSALESRNGELLEMRRASDGIYRLRTPLSEIPPALIRATLHYEDRWFAEHPGVNPAALLRAAFASLAGPRSMGASTITMQLARIRLGLETDTIPGKIRQIFWALRYEAHYEKDEILEAYLNLAPYGGNVEGVGAAARVWFGREAAALSPAQAAALSVVPQNPSARRPGRRAWAQACERLGRILTADEVFSETQAAPLLRPESLSITGPAALPHLARHNARLVHDLAPGERVRGAIDLALQESLEAIIHNTTARCAPWGIRNAAGAVLDARTGELLAHAGSADFNDARISGEVDALTAPRSPGSTLKPLLYGLAVDQGRIHSQTVLNDRPQGFGGWRPENADGAFAGPIPAADALMRSRNLPAVTLARDVNPDLYDLLRRAGVALPFERDHYGLGIALGGVEVTMADLLRLYGALAADGRVRPVVLGRTHEGRPVTYGADASAPILTPEAARVIRLILERGSDVPRTRSGARAAAGFKTGTSQGLRDAWAAGMIGPYVLVVWLGNFDGTPNPYLTGAGVAAPLWREAAAMLARSPACAEAASRPTTTEGLNIRRIPVCRETGDLDTALCPGRTTEALFIPGVSPVRPTGILREILVDKRTGLRACREDADQTERRVYAFWPTHMAEMMKRAGRPVHEPPAWMPGCGRAAPGTPPAILSPEAGTVRIADADGFARITLKAGTEPDAGALHWFADGRWLGQSKPGSALPARFAPGTHVVEALDDRGRLSAVQIVVKRP